MIQFPAVQHAWVCVLCRSHLIDINELVLSLRRLQKVPTDTKYQRIIQVLDEDKDGVIDAKDALRVSDLLPISIVLVCYPVFTCYYD